MTKRVLVINGPNLNMLGHREPDVYGTETLKDLQEYTSSMLQDREVELEWFQSNHEGEIVERIHLAHKSNDFDGLVINPGAFSHYSISILDALHIYKKPVIEVHLSNTHHREEFRRVKLTAKASTIIMEGLGRKAYYMGVLALLD